MRDLLVIVAVGVGTLALRAAFMVRGTSALPRRTASVLPYVAPAVLAAIAFPALLSLGTTGAVLDAVAAVAAVGASAAVWSTTRRFPAALLAGLAAWWLVLGAVAIWP
ncbi:AzlD domain-containing protein [Actinotalea sp. K2]|uniref:AzlD domain-containing protein n=1 Tax=Actinotalea sp. K2 TaxID=2939438 RepID=UPI0020179740|nr:AzlD domain-containing protein [Actinotalea sp. K2]MCL3861070.1 AzlD domain-containing protein [Actinotalea sp. K2]